MTRTVAEALAHAESVRGKPVASDSIATPLVESLVVLADEVKRLRELPRVIAGNAFALEDARGPLLTDGVGKVTRN